MIHLMLFYIIIFELIATVAIVYGFMHEKKIIEFEDRIIKKILKK